MDHRNVLLATRAVASVALGAFLLYGGMAVERSTLPPGALAAVIAVTLAGVVAAVWGLVRLHASRAAGVLVLVLLGLGPASAAVGWWFTTGLGATVLAGVHVVNLLAGVATLILSGWLLAQGAPAAAEERRVPRVG